MKTTEEYEATIATLTAALKKVDEMCKEGSRQLREARDSAASAREIARVAMTHTGTRAMRVEMTLTDAGISIIACDPAGDEVVTTQRMAKMLDAALWARIGVTFTEGPPNAVGSTA